MLILFSSIVVVGVILIVGGFIWDTMKFFTRQNEKDRR